MKRVLVVEDEFLIAELLASVLEERGYEVVMADNGRAGLDRMQKPPTVVITDFMMPVMSGLEFAQAVKAESQWQSIPIILISAAQLDIAHAQGHLFARLFQKPFDPDDIADCVEELAGAS